MIGVLFLSLSHQTINIMTLSGLALAVGILVDQATVTIENVHQHFEMGKEKRRAIFDACVEIAFPELLILLCILAVFAPSILMQGIPKAMFLPLSLAIGFSMIASYSAAQTIVPVLCNWILDPSKYAHYQHSTTHAHAGEGLDKQEIEQITMHGEQERIHPEENGFFQKIKRWFTAFLTRAMPRRKLSSVIYAIVTIALAGLGFAFIGKDMLPKINNGQFQMRLRAPEGTRLERTEEKTQQALAIIDSTVKGHVAISSAFVGPVSSNYATSNLFVFNSGTQEAVIQVELDKDYKIKTDELKEALRKNFHRLMPDVSISFEPLDLTEKIMSLGAANPVEVRVSGKNMDQISGFADSLLGYIKPIPCLRDVQIDQPLHYPDIDIKLDRLKIAQFGLNTLDVSNALISATSSSRFVKKILWLDEKTAYTYQVQVQVPEYVMTSLSELKEMPLIKGQNRPNLGDVAEFKMTTTPGEYDRTGARRFLTIGANVHETDLGTATAAVQKAVKKMGAPPRGVKVEVLGMSSLLTETLNDLQNGLMFAVLIIMLLLAANFESFPVAFTVISTVPAVITGALAMLLITGSTLNLQSYMGIIMSTGVSVANALLIVTNAERLRLEMKDTAKAAIVSASIRLRPILMTSIAMIAGMIPMATGLGEAGEQTAPLGRAVIGGLIGSTLAALFILPQVYTWVRERSDYKSSSLLPEGEI
jgi:multidrug efflux pump subunit AcrB